MRDQRLAGGFDDAGADGHVKTVIVPLIVVGAVGSVPASTCREAEDAVRRHPRSVETIARPAAERSADWFERQKHALRKRLGGTQIGVGTAAEARKEQLVRIARATNAFTGPARVIDGDTLDVGGVRICVHGIDAPEGVQQRLRPRRLGVGVVRRLEDRDEDLRLAKFSGVALHHRHRLPGIVDEHLLAGAVLLAHHHV